MSTSPSDRQAVLREWMEKVDPKYRSDTYWLLTHDVDSAPYWKWDRVPQNPAEYVEKFSDMCGCAKCKMCGMESCDCACSMGRRMYHRCMHHRGKLILLLLIVVGLVMLARERKA